MQFQEEIVPAPFHTTCAPLSLRALKNKQKPILVIKKNDSYFWKQMYFLEQVAENS